MAPVSPRRRILLTLSRRSHLCTDVEKSSALIDPVKADGTTPLVTAAMMGHHDVVRLLLDEGADVIFGWA